MAMLQWIYRHRSIQRKLPVVLLALALALSTMLATAQPTNAMGNKVGFTALSSVCVLNQCIGPSYLEHVTYGPPRGLAVNYDTAMFTGAKTVCNWWIDFDYYDAAGRLYIHEQGKMDPHCTITGSRELNYRPAKVFQAGQTCATLYSNARKLARGCNSISYN
jgi:hypothetical protein